MKLTPLICRWLGHKFGWHAKIDRDGFRCLRCNRLVRSITGRQFKAEKV